MLMQQKTISDSYWENLSLNDLDLDLLSNYLFEKEKPLSTSELANALIFARIKKEKEKEALRQSQLGTRFTPQNDYEEGQTLLFPALDWISGVVRSKRAGSNPDFEGFNVIEVEFEDKTVRCFASNLLNHPLNDTFSENDLSASVDIDKIFQKFGEHISHILEDSLSTSRDLVRIGESWFPKSLLIDFNQGHLNIVEAILDMQGGGPLEPKAILSQLDVDLGENPELTEFSLNYALQEDTRFDEVGTKGIYSWFLHRLEPEHVREIPHHLKYEPVSELTETLTSEDLSMLENIDDELIQYKYKLDTQLNNISFILSYPHWRIGSIPLTPKIKTVFPTALQTERVKISFYDQDDNETISAWLIRPNNYVYGLREWYEDHDLIPGSIISLEKTDDPGKIIIRAQKKRSNREWLKTILIGADGGIVLALLKQSVSAGFNDRMAIAVPDTEGLDAIWKERQNKQRPLKSDVTKMMQELSKLNQQHNVHFIELYAVLNTIRRVPPEPILQLLKTDPDFKYVGDQYYHMKDA